MKKILAVIIALVGLALYMFGRNYGGEYPLLKVLPYIIGAALLFVVHGTKKTIDLRECEVVSNNYQKEIQRGALPDVQAWNALNSETAVENIEINQSRLIYKEDNQTFISPLIYKDKTTLEFKLHEHKKANIYIFLNNEI